ncbi:MAG: GDSL-type esterase/lipase family protein [Candidatus Hydrogenedentes bacterium]|nr:GDSL-type esterase/lipase family protein [Candidatus Hydrogenedentota bacterium]
MRKPDKPRKEEEDTWAWHTEPVSKSQEGPTQVIAAGNNISRSLLLLAGSIVVVFLLTVAGDRIAGRFSAASLPPGSRELIFPPNSEHSFETCDFKYTAHINSLGLRDREIGPKKPGTFRIAMIGDSFTYGMGVDIEQAWIKQLEQNLQKAGYDVEVINVGKPGAGPPFFAEMAEKAVPILQPDLISVSMLQFDDLLQSTREGLEGLPANHMVLDAVKSVYPNLVRLVRIAQQARQVAANVQPVTPPQKTTAEDNRRWTAKTANDFHERMTPEERVRFDRLEDAVKTAYLAGRLIPGVISLAMQDPEYGQFTRNINDPRTQTLIQNLSEQLARIKRVAEDYNAKLVVVAIPSGPFVNRAALNSFTRMGGALPGDIDVLRPDIMDKEVRIASDVMDKEVRTACDKAGVRMFEVMEGFRKHVDEKGLYFDLDPHFTPTGNKLFAELVTPAFIKEIGDKAKKK